MPLLANSSSNKLLADYHPPLLIMLMTHGNPLKYVAKPNPTTNTTANILNVNHKYDSAVLST